MSSERHTTHNPRRGLGSRLVWHEISTVETNPMQDSARAESSAPADWQACITHTFVLYHRTGCTVFRAIVMFAMTTMGRSFTTHLTSLLWSIGFGSYQTHGSPVRTRAPDSPNLSLVSKTTTSLGVCNYSWPERVKLGCETVCQGCCLDGLMANLFALSSPSLNVHWQKPGRSKQSEFVE